tara:strand:+ start:408 stop:530 length:123 start_codon:yes stop_codon:yes gene_type:complete
MILVTGAAVSHSLLAVPVHDWSRPFMKMDEIFPQPVKPEL